MGAGAVALCRTRDLGCGADNRTSVVAAVVARERKNRVVVVVVAEREDSYAGNRGTVEETGLGKLVVVLVGVVVVEVGEDDGDVESAASWQPMFLALAGWEGACFVSVRLSSHHFSSDQ